MKKLSSHIDIFRDSAYNYIGTLHITFHYKEEANDYGKAWHQIVPE